MEKSTTLRREIFFGNIVGIRRITEQKIKELEELLGEKVFHEVDGKYVFDRSKGLCVQMIFPLTQEDLIECLESLTEDQRQEVLKHFEKEKVNE